MKDKLFSIYWSLAIIVLPIYHVESMMSNRIIRDSIFLILAITSLIIFENKPTKLIKLAGLFFGLTIISSKYLYISEISLWQATNMLTGIALASQVSTHWHSSKIFITNSISISCIIQTIWIFAEYFDRPLMQLGYLNHKDVYEYAQYAWREWPIRIETASSYVTAVFQDTPINVLIKGIPINF